MIEKLRGKIVLVTGASEGIGRATALAFAKGQAIVVLASRNEQKGSELLKEISSFGGTAIYEKTDVTIAQEVEDLLSRIYIDYGRLDCAFNNAGGGSVGDTIIDCSEEEWDYCVDLNLKSVWLCMKYEITLMMKQKRGVIVNNSSVDGLRAFPENVPYAASKSGVIGLSKSAALGYIDHGIRVNTICPGWIGTDRVKKKLEEQNRDSDWIKSEQPIGRLGTPEEVAQTVLWLCSEESSFITGQVIGVEGGYLL